MTQHTSGTKVHSVSLVRDGVTGARYVRTHDLGLSSGPPGFATQAAEGEPRTGNVAGQGVSGIS